LGRLHVGKVLLPIRQESKSAMKKKAQPQFAKGNAAHRQKRMRPTTGTEALALASEPYERFLKLFNEQRVALNAVVRALELTQEQLCEKTYLCKIECQITQLQSKQRLELITGLQNICDSHALLTRSQVVERIKELINA
jgi:hypothetical protein